MSKEGGERFVCPYYDWSRGLRVGCEGGCRVSFPDEAAMEGYIGAYCGHLPGWERCTVAAMRNGYYARQPD